MDKKLSIMIVDDEMIIRESFLHWFEKYGHVVGVASSGVEALEKLETFQKFDTIHSRHLYIYK